MINFRLLGLMLIVLLSVVIIPAQVAVAEEECFDYLNGDGQGDLIIPYEDSVPPYGGVYNGGGDWIDSEGATLFSVDYQFATAQLDFGETVLITSAELDTEWSNQPGILGSFFPAYMWTDNVLEPIAEDEEDGTSTTGTSSISFPGGAETDTIQFSSTATGSSPYYARITRISICYEDLPGGGDKTRPVAAADEHSDWGMFDYTYINSLDEDYEADDIVAAFSTVSGAPVAAVADGVVRSVEPFQASECLNGFSIGSLFLCAAVVPEPLSDTGFNQVYPLEMIGAYKVIVEDADDPNILYTYILAAPTVAVGDDVAAGCIIGRTIELKQAPFPTFEANIFNLGISGGLAFLSQPVEAGIVYVYTFEEGESAPLFPSLILPPSLAACQEAQLVACVNKNPELNSLEFYNADSDVHMLEEGDGVSIPRFQYIIQNNIIIDPEVTYTLSVQARARTAGGDDDFVTMNLQVTSQIEEVNVSTDWRNYTMETTGEDWHQGTVASVAVSNQQSSAADLEVRYICLSPVTASTAPGSCYFANHEFDQDGTGWTFDNTTFNFGQAYMRHGDTLTQPVILKPDDISTPHTYTIRAVARLLANGLYTGQVGKEVTLSYEYPFGDGLAEVGTIDSAAVLADGLNLVTGAVALDYAYTLETTIEITADQASAFRFEVAVTDGDNYIQGMRLDSVCIDPEGDGSFPDQPGDGGYIPPFIVGCATVPVPLEGSVGAWTFYHWSQLKRFFYCDLMKLLNNWFKQFEALRRVILGVARWWIALVHHVSRWIGTVFMWLNGSFNNLINGRVTTIVAGGGCHDIFCAIVDVISTLANLLTPIVAALESVVSVLLGVLVGTVNLFFTIIGGLVAFAVAIIIKLLSFFQLAAALLATLIGAYNTATPTVIDGLPMCVTDPDSSPLCVMVWATDNTIFAGRWAVLWVVFLSIAAIHLIIWAIREFKDVLLKTWGSS